MGLNAAGKVSCGGDMARVGDVVVVKRLWVQKMGVVGVKTRTLVT